MSPRILLGTTLARMGIASAGIDISDGLVLDLHRLCEAPAAALSSTAACSRSIPQAARRRFL